MALVVFLRGVNVGGHRTVRPSLLTQDLKHHDAVNIGAAGTFVIRKPASQAEVRAEFKIDTLFGVPVTTRNWNTITSIVKVLESGQ